MDDAVLIKARCAVLKLDVLDMKCDAKEIPESLSGAKTDGWWLAGVCEFDGKVATVRGQGKFNNPVDMSFDGQAAIAITEGRVLGIMSPGSETEPALWWAWPISSQQIGSDGAQGLFKN